MKTTIELPDELLIAAKTKAAQSRISLRALFERALRRELAEEGAEPGAKRRRPRLRWITVDGGLPPGLDLSNRERMHEWLRTRR